MRERAAYILNVQLYTGTYVCGPCDLLATRDLKSLYTARGETTLDRERGGEDVRRTDSVYRGVQLHACENRSRLIESSKHGRFYEKPKRCDVCLHWVLQMVIFRLI